MFQSLAQLFVQVLAPILIMTGAGYALQSRLHLDTRSISRLVFYILAPCLIYTSILTTEFESGVIGRMVAFAAVNMMLMGLTAYALGRKWGYKGALGSAFVVTNILLNNGNYGLPLNLFAFGEQGFAYAVVLFMFNSLVGSAISIYLLARSRNGADGRLALRRTLGAPVIWAMTLGLLSRVTGIAPQGSLLNMLQMAGRAAIPVFLVVLGMTLTTTRARLGPNPITRLTLLRMLGGPALAIPLALFVGLSGVAYAVAVMQASMPTAVNSIILSNEFEAAPDFVAGAVFFTTIVSVFTLPLLLFWLK
ncbi:MAG: AEC family transporter [Chloroflexi bacterium]|nr:AEC family transporter [Chloroflexota bacterium]